MPTDPIPHAGQPAPCPTVYDALGRLVAATDPPGSLVTFTIYDAGGRVARTDVLATEYPPGPLPGPPDDGPPDDPHIVG